LCEETAELEITFTIIIPSYNRDAPLRRLLAGIEDLSPDSPEFEVIVVDDGSEPAVSIDVNFYSFPLIVIRNNNGGPARARNNGAQSARGAFLAFIDDDCVPHPDWLLGFDEYCGNDPGTLLGGQTLNGCENNVYSEATQLLINFLLEHYNPADIKGGFYPTNNMSIPKASFLSLGGFNTSLSYGEDRELCYRWALENNRFKWVRNAKVFHFHELDFVLFLKLHAKYGTGSLQFHQIASNELQSPVSLSRFTFYLKLICHPLSRGVSIKTMQLTFLLFCTQAANLGGMTWQWWKSITGNK